MYTYKSFQVLPNFYCILVMLLCNVCIFKLILEHFITFSEKFQRSILVCGSNAKMDVKMSKLKLPKVKML
jgi:hypothetical protein